MKLYLTQILKEANQAGFANQPNTSFSAHPAPTGPTATPLQTAPTVTPTMVANPQAGGMMLPGQLNPSLNIPIQGPGYKTVI